jgi:Tfp pilus assembly protein PilE
MKSPNNQSGFSALDIVLGIVLVAAIAAAGYFSYQNMHKSAKSPTASVSLLVHATPTPSQDPTAGWKTYTSAFEQASFKYPSTWAMKQTQGSDPTTNDYQVTLTSPHGLMLKYTDDVSGIGGGCPAAAKQVVFTKAQPVSAIKSAGPVYLAENGSGLGLDVDATLFTHTAPPDLSTGTCQIAFVLPSKKHSTQIGFGSDIVISGAAPAYTTAQLQDVPMAEQILESFRY